MRSKIEELRSLGSQHSIVRRWPQAVQTPEGVVIPRFVQVTECASLEACVNGTDVALRPRLHGHTNWESERRTLLEYLEVALDVSLREESTPYELDEEWGDFTVWCR